ncbi:MAG: sugar transferase, partial [Candidatus Hydrogenedentales bacterium]
DLTGFAAAEDYSLALARLQAGQPIVEPAGCRSMAYRVPKRLLDIAGAIVAIVLLLPMLIPVFVVLLITTRGRPFYTQERVGYCGRRFKMIKFRTMRLDADKLRHLVANEKDGPIFKAKRDPRITRVGRWLRKSSIDELPQLLNVLVGDMSLVGPRPALAKEVAQYAPWQRRRFCVMPGLTCLWQVSGRSDIGFEQWVRMDLWYVQHQSLWTDIKLLLRTPWCVISMRGAY